VCEREKDCLCRRVVVFLIAENLIY
jgi:hypothetical protein